MDRPVDLSFLRLPDRGIYTIGSRDPESLERLSLELFSRLQASDATGFVAGMHLGGGGGGAAWIVTYSVVQALGEGFAATSVWASNARASFGIAATASEIDRVVARLLDRIATEGFPNYPNAGIYDVQIAGGGRDGAYLIAVLWGTATPPPYYIRKSAESPQGPFNTETALLSTPLRVPPTADFQNQVEYLLFWGAILNETTGSAGVALRLQFSTVPAVWTTIAEVTFSAPASEWRAQGGVSHQLQTVDPTLAVQPFYRLVVEPNPTSEVSARNAYLYALRAGDDQEIS